MVKGFQILFFILLAGQIYAQKERVVMINVVGSEGEVINTYENAFTDSLQLKNTLEKHLFKFYQDGYLMASYKVVSLSEKQIKIMIKTGSRFRLDRLGKGNMDEALLSKIGYKEKTYNKEPFKYGTIRKLFENALTYSENHGYPFATIKLDSISIKGNKINGILNYENGPKFVFDTLVLKGVNKTKWKWLSAYLKIFPGQLYDDKAFRNIGPNIRTLSFLSMTSTPDLHFENGKATITLHLHENEINRIDGILGLLPNQQNNKKLLVTGRLDLGLFNLFGTGKEIQLYWEKLNTKTQDFNAQYYHPNFLKMPLGIGTKFFLHKEDTSFLNRNFKIYVDFIPAARQRLAFETEFMRSRIIDPGVEQNALPAINNVDVNYYGLDYKINLLDDIFIPRKGWLGMLTARIGDRNVIKNPEVDEKVYEGVPLKGIQYLLRGGIDKYFSLNKNLVIRSRLIGGWIISDQLFVNDLFQVGGFNSIRGFNQNHFYADRFIYGNFECRLISVDDTYFFVFYDQGFVKNSVSLTKDDYLFGLGAGINFTTKTGMFNFVFAIGKSNDQNLDFNQSKIHFGYTGRF